MTNLEKDQIDPYGDYRADGYFEGKRRKTRMFSNFEADGDISDNIGDPEELEEEKEEEEELDEELEDELNNAFNTERLPK